ncbi:hexameric tyrosine-coordinated heme protein [Neobacillus sp. YX16]|nr:hexameric tyrosine-coordinated heme protein [Neobacillus sp. YX16]WHZ06206.1 hexameric tyrosine-coordinated heme protein [Neobacillus sp. YX16]
MRLFLSKGVAYTQPSADVWNKLRTEYEGNADSLTLSSQVIATHFQTVAAANNHWKLRKMDKGLNPCSFFEFSTCTFIYIIFL